MPTGFVADQMSVTEEHGVLVVALGAPSTEEEDFYLMLQHKDEYDEQDVNFGMNEPYIEYCGQGWSWYGHIDQFELLRDRVKVQMNETAASRMGNDGHIEVQFSLGEQEFGRLRAALRRTFYGRAFFIEGV
jgi:Immunity protein 10